MQLADVQQKLNVHGFRAGRADGLIGPKTIQAVKRFQEAFAGGREGITWSLSIDGIPGANTKRALQELPWLSPHFKSWEFACRHCADVVCRRELVRGLEALRRVNGRRPLAVVSGYRCPPHNAAVGGAARSQHLYGTAADLGYPCPVSLARDLGVFSGIGQKNGRVRHVDVRHARSDTNPTPGVSGTRPAMWNY